MFCNKCGTKVKDGSRFCPVCGNEISGRSMPDSGAVRNNGQIFQGNGNWYTVNWKRIGDGQWSGEALKHHLAWIGMHLAIIFVFILTVKGIAFMKNSHVTAILDKPSNTADGADDTASDENDTAGDSTTVADDPVSTDDQETLSDFMYTATETVNYYTKVAFDSLEGTWTDANRTFTLTIGQDGSVRIAEPTGTLGADVFTWSEVDDDTIRLKADSDNFLASFLSIDMDYKVSGEVLTVELMDMSYDLMRKE